MEFRQGFERKKRNTYLDTWGRGLWSFFWFLLNPCRQSTMATFPVCHLISICFGRKGRGGTEVGQCAFLWVCVIWVTEMQSNYRLCWMENWDYPSFSFSFPLRMLLSLFKLYPFFQMSDFIRRFDVPEQNYILKCVAQGKNILLMNGSVN